MIAFRLQESALVEAFFQVLYLSADLGVTLLPALFLLFGHLGVVTLNVADILFGGFLDEKSVQRTLGLEAGKCLLVQGGGLIVIARSQRDDVGIADLL